MPEPSTQGLNFEITTDPPPRVVQGQLGRAVRDRKPPEVIDHLRGELALANVRQAVRRELEKAPPLSDDQLARLRPLFALDIQ